MKKHKINILLVLLFSFFIIDCSNDDKPQIKEKELIVKTMVRVTAQTNTGIKKPNYYIMLFDEYADPLLPLPRIKFFGLTNAEGVATIDLNEKISSIVSTTFYIEALVIGQNGYKSITHPVIQISKGQQIDVTILVN